MTDVLSALRAAATTDPPAGATEVATVVVASAETAAPALWAYFGSDDHRAVCRLIVSAEDVGFVARSAALLAMADQMRGLGDLAAPATLPGVPTGSVDIELRCDEAGCRLNPFHTLVFDADYPPRCPLHQRALHPPEAV
jgi:hypothetical protein